MRYKILLLFALSATWASAQQVLSLDSCRALALRNNKQLGISRVTKDVASEVQKSARTKYLPQVNAVGGYMWSSREISLLSKDQKNTLKGMGSALSSDMSQSMQSVIGSMSDVQKYQLNQFLSEFGTDLTSVLTNLGQQTAAVGGVFDGIGSQVVDAFRTDTRNMFGGAVMVSQPIYMGGAITAMNNMADIAIKMADNQLQTQEQSTLYNIDQIYWTVVSLKQKKHLAESFLKLVRKLDSDVQKMIREGVATRSDGLSVSVKVNEAEMTVTQVDNGLNLAKMLLCQTCGLPMDEQVTLADEDKDDLGNVTIEDITPDKEVMYQNRPELKLLQNSVDLSNENVHLLRAGNLPKVMLIGGYAVTNPNVYDGYQNRFGGAWHVGVAVQVPVWNWGDVTHKVHAAKGLATIAQMEMSDLKEKMELQMTQSSYKVSEAARRLTMANTNIAKAEENLRCANVGFAEGVISSTTVMEAQTAWMQAQSQRIDAEIDVKMSQADLRKAMGSLSMDN